MRRESLELAGDPADVAESRRVLAEMDELVLGDVSIDGALRMALQLD